MRHSKLLEETTYTSLCHPQLHPPTHTHTYPTWSLPAVSASRDIFHTVLTTNYVHFVPPALAQHPALDPSE